MSARLVTARRPWRTVFSSVVSMWRNWQHRWEFVGIQNSSRWKEHIFEVWKKQKQLMRFVFQSGKKHFTAADNRNVHIVLIVCNQDYICGWRLPGLTWRFSWSDGCLFHGPHRSWASPTYWTTHSRVYLFLNRTDRLWYDLLVMVFHYVPYVSIFKSNVYKHNFLILLLTTKGNGLEGQAS